MEDAVKKLFERYERLFNQALGGDMDAQALASLYASDFIAASPAGVRSGKNDAQLWEIMAQGYDRHRIRRVDISPIDENHCIAHVAWTASYARKDRPDVAIDFDIHYLVQKLRAEAKVFGWVSGDEEALLKEHGIT